MTFFHKGPLPAVPASVRQLEVLKADGTIGTRLWVDDEAGLIGLVKIGAAELRPWGSTVADIERPDRTILDLDPDEGLPWDAVADAAFQLREHLTATRATTEPCPFSGYSRKACSIWSVSGFNR